MNKHNPETEQQNEMEANSINKKNHEEIPDPETPIIDEIEAKMLTYNLHENNEETLELSIAKANKAEEIAKAIIDAHQDPTNKSRKG